MSAQPVLINGEWTPSSGRNTFRAVNPTTRELLPEEYPISPWDELEQAIEAAATCYRQVSNWPGERFARFLDAYAEGIEAATERLVEMAHVETALPASPRLKDVELPRTTNQLRLAAAAAREGTWTVPTIDTKTNIRSVYRSLGPVAVFGPNNFPFAFNGISGGDFAAAVAAGNPVIAKGHASHPGTTRIFAKAAANAADKADMPPGFVQLIYRTSHENGAKLVGHPLMGATGYTGSRSAGLVLKEAADKAGKPIYLELSSINPVFVLSGALKERMDEVADQFTTSCLMGTGQFCTNPGLVVVPDDDAGRSFLDAVKGRFEQAPVGTMLSEGVQRGFEQSLNELKQAGAELITGGSAGGGQGFCEQNTLLAVSGKQFLANPEGLQAEAFGNSALFVLAENPEQMTEIARLLEGNLTGCLYSDTGGSDDDAYESIATELRLRVGRLLNDKMPTGVAVSPAMNHGGPYPATGHPGFTAVGIPASIRRFAQLACYDDVRPHRLPPVLQDKNPTRSAWRYIDGEWTRGDAPA